MNRYLLLYLLIFVAPVTGWMSARVSSQGVRGLTSNDQVVAAVHAIIKTISVTLDSLLTDWQPRWCESSPTFGNLRKAADRFKQIANSGKGHQGGH